MENLKEKKDKESNSDESFLQTEAVSVALSPKGIEIDEAGRIRFTNPEILQAFITAKPADISIAAEGNTIQCVCNNYQCGKQLM